MVLNSKAAIAAANLPRYGRMYANSRAASRRPSPVIRAGGTSGRGSRDRAIVGPLLGGAPGVILGVGRRERRAAGTRPPARQEAVGGENEADVVVPAVRSEEHTS